MNNLDDSIDNVDTNVDIVNSKVDDVHTKIERVEEKMEEMVIEVSALHHKVHDISEHIDMIYNFLSR